MGSVAEKIESNAEVAPERSEEPRLRVASSPGDPVERRPGRPEASAAIWRWQERASQSKQPPAMGRSLRASGLVRAAIGIAIGAAFFFLWSKVVAYIAFAVAGSTGMCALVSPNGAYAAIERAMGRFAGLVGQVMTVLLMTPLFYLFFLPFGLMFRRGKRDSMKRFYDSSVETYWTERNDDDTGSRTRQF